LGDDDPELAAVLSGDAYTMAVKKGEGIRDAMAERDARAEMVYLEIDEKKEAVEALRITMHVAQVIRIFETV
jgi:hypothetical protein